VGERERGRRRRRRRRRSLFVSNGYRRGTEGACGYGVTELLFSIGLLLSVSPCIPP